MDFDQSLFDVQEAATSCGANARNFVDSFSKCLWSKSLLAASRQATRRLGQVNRAADRLEDHVRKFDHHPEINAVLEHIQWANPRPVTIERTSYTTAHEAAIAFAQAVLGAVSGAEGATDRAICESLAKQLRRLSRYPDFYGLIEGEYRRAVTTLKPVELSGKEKRTKRDKQIRKLCKDHKVKGEWTKLADIANDDPVIKALGLRRVTKDIARDAIVPVARRCAGQ